jgi:hypothetical protein
MSLAIDAALSLGSLTLTVLFAIGLRIGFRRGRSYGDF